MLGIVVGYRDRAAHPKAGAGNKALRKEREPLIKTARPGDWDGLSDLEYRIVERRTLVAADGAGRGHFELARVDFRGPA